MIEPLLFSALGALAATLFWMLALPGVRRRAEARSRRAVEASMPVSLNRIEADRDAVRAEFAASSAKAEADLRAQLDRYAEQAITAGRAEEQARLLRNEKDELALAASRMEEETAALRETVAATEAALREREAELAEQARRVEEVEAETAKLGRMFEEASFLASTRQIDLVARDAELERVTAEIDRVGAELERIRAGVREGGPTEKERALTAELFSAEGRIEKGRTELERLRRQVKAGNAEQQRMADELIEVRKERMGQELEYEALSRQLSQLFPGIAPGGDPIASLKAAAAERDRVEARIATLQRENRDLHAVLDEEPEVSARFSEGALREEMLRLAAQVTAVAAKLEGPDGEIARVLDADAPQEPDGSPSLAGRIRRLLAADEPSKDQSVTDQPSAEAPAS